MITGMRKNYSRWVTCALFASSFAAGVPVVSADTIVHLGTIGQITGAADLDLDGDIVHAINLRGETVEIAGVSFVSDDTAPAGTTLVGPNFATDWQTRPELGDTADDNALEELFHNLRLAVPSEILGAEFDVKIGHRYKVQMLISANQDESRSWDISVNGALGVEEFTSLGTNADTYSVNRAVAYVFEIDASQPTLEIVMGQINDTIEGTDGGALWQGITLEDLGPGPDGDGDGMPDSFESAFALDIENDDSAADGDSDNSSNLEEFTQASDPTNDDSDGDGLKDGVETGTGTWVSR